MQNWIEYLPSSLDFKRGSLAQKTRHFNCFQFCVYVYCSQTSFPLKSLWHDRAYQFTVLSTLLGKTVFAWRFILNENILFWLTISYQKPFVFPVSVFCSQVVTLKLKFYSKKIFCLRKYFYFSLLNLNYWCFRNFRKKKTKKKKQKKTNKWNLLKHASLLPTLLISA